VGLSGMWFEGIAGKVYVGSVEGMEVLLRGGVDTLNGCGWRPVTTSTLLSMGRQSPRSVVGTVNTAEFLVAMVASTGFVIGLWPQLREQIFAVIALLIGG
ncbi:sulfite exporter TauE/SafE family protein, partial [Corynebacterium belfantii]|nr:sulfite exporter TauE/SafE family protein [Corynebacterium belfantii]MBG9308477.1 sulfite exporter TauE/SafE family protein [Corynebacterium belfantii]